MEELKIVMETVQAMADTGLTAFIWWLVMDKLIWWVLAMVIAIGAWQVCLRLVCQNMFLRGMRDMAIPSEAGTCVSNYEMERVLSIFKKGLNA